ncbi:DnaJ domain-containing protein [Nocardioides antri]|uniref:DnaJ domain-containing protein n=1 Tax=Nocardioides antri TaxID=2607659 RepID=A0A5B1M587_9ACTN|nr:DnaJ domain-containing protein [Nocardioides antri]KAA1426840.1 DnaJ domain-containing protein [Nocardioides antri]
MGLVDPKVRAAFALLGLRPDADQLAVLAAYRRLARATHPDVSSERDAAERFTALSAAYQQAMAAAPERTAPADPPEEAPSTARPFPRATPATGRPFVAGPVRVEPAPGEGWGEEILWIGPVVRLHRGGRRGWT